MDQWLIDVIGWVGSLAVLLAYGLISAEKISGKSKLYQWLNVFGSICLMLNAYHHRAYPPTFVNAVWLAIALWALFSSFLKQMRMRKQ